MAVRAIAEPVRGVDGVFLSLRDAKSMVDFSSAAIGGINSIEIFWHRVANFIDHFLILFSCFCFRGALFAKAGSSQVEFSLL